MIILIAAASENNALGKDNQLVWHLPDDFKRFKELTTGHYIIMGRKTFAGFPKPLPNRTHVVITRQDNYKPDGCIVVKSLQEALDVSPKNEDVYIIGGGEIFNLSMDTADKIEMTRVHAEFEGDAFFPEINADEWLLAESVFHPADDRHSVSFTFETYVRR
ncbi:MAG TPA: dihydrofolate reductase [Flavobacterium sp.]|jgi:dihydrofolate reductase